MKSFKSYLEESQREYCYRIKTVVQPTDQHMDAIERLLRSYQLIRVETPVTIDNKADSMEFRDLEHSQVHYVDVVIGVPISAYMLQQELRIALDVPEKFVVVRADNEPIEVQSERSQLLTALNNMAQERGLGQRASLLSTDRMYLDAEQPQAVDVFGDKYNKGFLNYLADVAASRKPTEFEAQSSHISVADLKAVRRDPSQDVADFNDRFDTPKPTTKARTPVEAPADPTLLNRDGNFDDDTINRFDVKRDGSNRRVVNQLKSDPVRPQSKVSK
jgi:hypothetical protein